MYSFFCTHTTIGGCQRDFCWLQKSWKNVIITGAEHKVSSIILPLWPLSKVRDDTWISAPISKPPSETVKICADPCHEKLNHLIPLARWNMEFLEDLWRAKAPENVNHSKWHFKTIQIRLEAMILFCFHLHVPPSSLISVAPLLTPFGAWDGNLAETADHHGEKERSGLILVVLDGFLGWWLAFSFEECCCECCCTLERWSVFV